MRHAWRGGRRWAATLLLASAAGCAAVGRGGAAMEWWAFAGPWDAASDASIAAHGDRLDHVVTGWIALDTADGRPRQLFADTLGNGRRWQDRRFALVTSWFGDRFHPETVRRLADDDAALEASASRLTQLVRAGAYRGAVFDFEGHAPSDLAALRRVTRRLADAVRAGGGREVALAIPALDTVAFPAAPLADDVDRLVLMLYDRHWAGSEPGPVAPLAWVDTALAVRLAEVPADRLVAAFPLYGYRWPPRAAGETIGLADARRIADSAGVPLVRDSASWHLTATLPNGGALWVADEAVLARLLAGAQQHGIRRAAFWRLGLEDPGVWSLPRRPRRPLPDR